VIETYLIEADCKSDRLTQPQINKVNTLGNKDNTNDNYWILDSGATQHVTGNLELISGLQNIHTIPLISVGGELHTIKGKEKVFVEFLNGKIKCFDDVLYVPGIHINLLLIGCIVDTNCSIEF